MRPPKQGPAVTARDLEHIGRILRRVEADVKRPAAERRKIIGHLTSVLVLLSGARAKKPLRKVA